ncbi:MAG: rhomboid family intramembrane serine protease [candidate division WOR-3 bacterium]|nr:rhomboid family intramembrane serine protease [candidate division WOR-3 bacterium]MCX7836869.1 rhomboid family intramembrane serine protease [candidate division WOR-3 bacterium]MDW8114333.1 rhomboid family intramembrane serine protease [candidate division WOR-3 bacterium]
MIPLKDDIPSLKRPIFVYFIVIINILIFLYEMSLGVYLRDFILEYGIIPISIIQGERLHTLITGMFLHGNFVHILGNMLYLWVFGDNVEDILGHFWFLIMYILSGLAGSFLHILRNVYSQTPMIGASGAISGVLGAYLVLFPNARILTLIPIGFFLRIALVPAFLFLGIWILLQFLYSSIGVPGVAWSAHIGGFFIGLIIGLFFRKKKRRIDYEVYDI